MFSCKKQATIRGLTRPIPSGNVSRMLRLRLQRVGRKHEPVFRVVLTESQNSTKSGRFGEILGSYDPRTDKVALQGDRIKYWISVGARATPTVHNLLITQKLLQGKKINVLSKKTVPKKEEVKAELKNEVKEETVVEVAQTA